MNQITSINRISNLATIDGQIEKLDIITNDINYYFHTLKMIANGHQKEEIREQAKTYLGKQLNIQLDLVGLQIVVRDIKSDYVKMLSGGKVKPVKLYQKMIKFESDMAHFDKINSKLRKICFRFTNEYFQHDNRQYYKAA